MTNFVLKFRIFIYNLNIFDRNFNFQVFKRMYVDFGLKLINFHFAVRI